MKIFVSNLENYMPSAKTIFLKKMKILINAKLPSTVCEVARENIGKNYAKEGHEVFFDKKDYAGFDIIMFFSLESEVKKAKKQNPQALIGILDPKLNNKRDELEAGEADFLLVSSLEQQEFALKFNPNVQIFNWFLPMEPKEKIHTKKDKIIIGYHGNKIHLNCFIHHIKDTLEKIKDSGCNIELHAIYNIKKLGCWKIGVPDITVRHIQWERETYCDYLYNCDIGIVPNILPVSHWRTDMLTRLISHPISFNYNKKDYFLRFKFSSNQNRFYEFSQLGIPVITDMYPSACQIIQHGISGFLAYSSTGWYNALLKLINNPELRNKCAENLRKYIDSDLSPEQNFLKLKELSVFLGSFLI